MATISEMNIAGTLYDIQDTVSGYLKATDAANTYLSKTTASSTYVNKWTNSNHWYNVDGMSIHKYEGQDVNTYKLPTSFCYVISMLNGSSRGSAIAIDWRGTEQRIWANHLHDDTNSYNWSGWYDIKGAGCPNYNSAVNMGLPVNPLSGSTATYTCPADGWVFVTADRGSTSGYTLYINVNNVTVSSFPAHFAYYTGQAYLPVCKGDVIKFTTDSTSTTWTVRRQQFYYNR